MIPYSKDDIDSKAAYEAFAHSNSSPHELADRVKAEYIKDMSSLITELQLYANEQNLAQIEVDLLEYKMTYLNKLHGWLRSRTSFVSPFIAGRSKFNHKQMTNRARSSDKSGSSLSEWEKSARIQLITKYKPSQQVALPSYADLQARLETLQTNRAFMKKVNVIMKGDSSSEQKASKLLTMGITQEKIDLMIANKFYFLIHELDSNQAKIVQVKKKINSIKRNLQ